MQTAICAFGDRARAEQAVDRLVRAGFAREDIHIEHRPGQAGGGRHPSEQEAEGDRSALSALGHFFTSLLGQDNPSGRVDTYAQHVERGGCVLVVDARDDAQAQHARTVLNELQGGDLHVVQRSQQRPLRDIVSSRGAVAGMVERSREPYENRSSELLVDERAMASDRLDAIEKTPLRDPDVTHAPGLRYADKDKPNR